MTITPIPVLKAKSPHTQPAVAAGIGVAVGILTLAQAFFASGHLPSSAEVASVLAGAGLTLGSVGAYIGHHLGWLKAVGPSVAAAEPALAAAAAKVPGLEERIGEVEHAVQEQVSKVAPAVDVPAVAELVLAHLAGKAPAVPAAAPATPPAATQGA